MLWVQVVPKAQLYLDRYRDYREAWEEIREDLELVPRDGTVTASTYLTQGLWDCRELYDVYYTTDEHLYASDYVVLHPLFRSDCRRWDTEPDAGDGTEVLRSLLEKRGYRLLVDRAPWIVIYEKAPSAEKPPGVTNDAGGFFGYSRGSGSMASWRRWVMAPAKIRSAWRWTVCRAGAH